MKNKSQSDLHTDLHTDLPLNLKDVLEIINNNPNITIMELAKTFGQKKNLKKNS